jgi:hypothetical protein
MTAPCPLYLYHREWGMGNGEWGVGSGEWGVGVGSVVCNRIVLLHAQPTNNNPIANCSLLLVNSSAPKQQPPLPIPYSPFPLLTVSNEKCYNGSFQPQKGDLA